MNEKWSAFKALSENERKSILEKLYADGATTREKMGACFGVDGKTISYNIPGGFGRFTEEMRSKKKYEKQFLQGCHCMAICVDCERTNDKSCSWFRRDPVFPNGVTMIYKKIVTDGKGSPYRFMIIKCPRYKKEAKNL